MLLLPEEVPSPPLVGVSVALTIWDPVTVGLKVQLAVYGEADV